MHIILTDAQGLADNDTPALLLLQISRSEVETGNIASALERLHVVAETRESVLRYRECLVFQVQGYDADPRELPEIAQVRAYFERLAAEWPHWLWFLARDVGAVALLFALLCRVQIHRRALTMGMAFKDTSELLARFQDLAQRSTTMCQAFGLSEQEFSASLTSAAHELAGDSGAQHEDGAQP